MGLFANLRVRRKLLIALAPMLAMVLFATLYSSAEMLRIDGRYSDLMANDGRAVVSLSRANQRLYRLGMLIYQEIAESDPQRVRRIDGEFDQAYAEYAGFMADGQQAVPQRSKAIGEIR